MDTTHCEHTGSGRFSRSTLEGTNAVNKYGKYRVRFFLMIAIASLVLVTSNRPARSSEIPEGFVELQEAIPGIIIDLKYAGPDNVFGEVLYTGNACLIRTEVANALLRVQNKLRERGLQLVVWDAFRPIAVQRKMWQKVPDERYVANPEKGSRHNRGAAVDVTLADSTGNRLLMPTAYDDFSEKAHRDYRDGTAAAAGNALLLEKLMTSEGFLPLPTEWWHFDYEGWEQYPIVDERPEGVEAEQLRKK